MKLLAHLLFANEVQRFNRTRVELKQIFEGSGMGTINRFNRTRVELKHNLTLYFPKLFLRFNRTRVELKLFYSEDLIRL